MKLVKLLVKKHYRSREIDYPEDKTIEVPENEAEFLLRDAPGCFEVVIEKAVKAPEDKKEPEDNKGDEKAVDDPPVNKMVDEPPADKGVKSK